MGEVRKAAGGGFVETVLNVFTDGDLRWWPIGGGGCCRCIEVGVCADAGKTFEDVVLVRECEYI